MSMRKPKTIRVKPRQQDDALLKEVGNEDVTEEILVGEDLQIDGCDRCDTVDTDICSDDNGDLEGF